MIPQYVTFLLFIFSVTTPSNYATEKEGSVTLFKNAFQNGTTALIAHNYLAGRYFGGLDEGDEITLIYPDHNQAYEVHDILRYRALTLFAYRVEVGESHVFSDREVFDFIYHSNDGRLVLQTCYDGANGRLFIIAYPKKNSIHSVIVSML